MTLIFCVYRSRQAVCGAVVASQSADTDHTALRNPDEVFEFEPVKTCDRIGLHINIDLCHCSQCNKQVSLDVALPKYLPPLQKCI